MSGRSHAWHAVVNRVGEVEAELGRTMQEAHGLGLSEFRALQALAESPKGELRMQDLALRLGLNQSSVSRMVERLERTGVTVRDVCPDDKRGVYTVLTETGRAKLGRAETTYDRAIDEALAKHRCAALVDALQGGPGGEQRG